VRHRAPRRSPQRLHDFAVCGGRHLEQVRGDLLAGPVRGQQHAGGTPVHLRLTAA